MTCGCTSLLGKAPRRHPRALGLAFINVNILVAAAAIGLATMTMVTIGTMLGRALGNIVGQRAEIIGGIVLMLVGVTILYEHLSAAA